VKVSTGTVTLAIVAKGPGTVLTLPDGIAAHWDLRQVEPQKLGGGYHNTVLRVGDVVVRLEKRDPASVAWEHELLAWLKPEVPEVVAPLPAVDGTTALTIDGQTASVLPFVEGTPGGGLAAAEVLARIHVRGAAWPAVRPRPGRPSYAELDWEHNDWWDWSAVQKPPELVRAFEHTRAWIASDPPLVRTPVHGDPARQNVLAGKDRIVGVIDWEWARVDWPGVELALAAWTFAEDDRASFVDAYLDAGGPGERAALHEGRRIQLLANALYSLTRVDSDPEWIAYLLSELRELP
jgi:Ser/Thr protein kinase RdoA (MazF antagonist)